METADLVAIRSCTIKIGIVGCGVVGGACKFGFEKLGHDVSVHDVKLSTKLSDLLEMQIIFICVPTPMLDDGSCDVSIVEEVTKELEALGYLGLAVIKSTVTPGTTRELQSRYPALDLAFVPEFLRERCATTDFVENQKLLAIGYDGLESWNATKLLIDAHGSYPKAFRKMSTVEAELLKYYHNTFNALRVVFANEFYKICEAMGANYTEVKKALLDTSGVPDIYLDVNKNMRGYSSICWNKDIPALYRLIDELGLVLPLIETIVPANDKFKKTPFHDTRETY